VINVSGHRLGTREIEETICSRPAVAEAAAVGAKDELRGQAIHCFVVVKQADVFGRKEKQNLLQQKIESTVVSKLGAFARPAAIYLVRALPKTRSGKILRRAILAAAEGRDTGDLTTLEDPIALDSIREIVSRIRGSGGKRIGEK
jgi:propionyl-CoA synthetase